MLYTSDRLILRQWQEEDFLPFTQLSSDPQVMEYMPNVLSEEEATKWAKSMQKFIAEKKYGLFAVELIATHKFIGYAGLIPVTFSSSFTPAVEIGWRLDREYWGNGYATEAARYCLQLAWSQLKLSRVVSFTALPNNRSIRVMQKLGMHKSGEFKHPRLAEDHWLCDHVLYEIEAPTKIDAS